MFRKFYHFRSYRDKAKRSENNKFEFLACSFVCLHLFKASHIYKHISES